MQKLDEKLASIDETLSDTSIYNDARKNELLKLLEEKAQHEKAKDEAETLWFEAQEALEEAQQAFDESLNAPQ